MKYEDIAKVEIIQRLEAYRLVEPLAKDCCGLVEPSQLLIGKCQVKPGALVRARLEYGSTRSF